MTHKHCAITRQRGERGVRHALPDHRRVAPGRMEAGHRLPFKQQNVRYAPPREVIGSGGARESRTDNDAFVRIHDLTTANLLLLIAHSSAFSQPAHPSYSAQWRRLTQRRESVAGRGFNHRSTAL